MIGIISAIVGVTGFVVYLVSIVFSVLKSSIITFTAALPVLIIVAISFFMLGYDFIRMLSLTNKIKTKNKK